MCRTDLLSLLELGAVGRIPNRPASYSLPVLHDETPHAVISKGKKQQVEEIKMFIKNKMKDLQLNLSIFDACTNLGEQEEVNKV